MWYVGFYSKRLFWLRERCGNCLTALITALMQNVFSRWHMFKAFLACSLKQQMLPGERSLVCLKQDFSFQHPGRQTSFEEYRWCLLTKSVSYRYWLTRASVGQFEYTGSPGNLFCHLFWVFCSPCCKSCVCGFGRMIMLRLPWQHHSSPFTFRVTTYLPLLWDYLAREIAIWIFLGGKCAFIVYNYFLCWLPCVSRGAWTYCIRTV